MKTQTLILLFLGCVIAFLLASDGICQTNQKNFPLLKGSYLGQKPPGAIPKIFAPGIVSTNWCNHCTISVSSDGSEIYWAMAPVDMPGQIYFSKIVNGVWAEPEIVSFTQSEDGDCPVLSPDGIRMYFNSNRPLPQKNDRRERIWCVVGTAINSGSHEGCPFVAPDGSYLIFSRDGLWISFKEKTGNWTKAISMGDRFKEAICPYISPDGKYLFYLEMGMGYNDIYWVETRSIESLHPKETNLKLEKIY